MLRGAIDGVIAANPITPLVPVRVLQVLRRLNPQPDVLRADVCRVRFGICSCRLSDEKHREKVVVKHSGRCRASFPKEQGAATFHQKFHSIFHGDFHWLNATTSLQQVCMDCREDYVKGFFEGFHCEVFACDHARLLERGFRPPARNIKK